jgi:general stress protein YciG
MTDRSQSDDLKRGIREKLQPDMAVKSSQTDVGRSHIMEDRKRSGTTGRIVGRDVPDESKERHTEIAVEAGRKGGERREDQC